MKYSYTLCVLLCLGFLWGCNNAVEKINRKPADKTPPTATTLPENGALNVLISTDIRVFFSEAMNTDSLTPANVKVYQLDENGSKTEMALAQGTEGLRYNSNDHSLTIKTGNPLEKGITDRGIIYQVELFAHQESQVGIKDVAGNRLSPDSPGSDFFIWRFTTEPPPFYTIGGTVTGLTGTGLVLQNNGGDPLAVKADGNFTFTVALLSGSDYSLSVFAQPSTPAQTCQVIAPASGTVASAPVSNLQISCVNDPIPPPRTYTIGGSITGLRGSGLVLQNNAGGNLAISTNSRFVFNATIESGGSYRVSVLTQPSLAQHCTVTNGAGTVSSANVTDVEINCAASVVFRRTVNPTNSDLYLIKEDGTGLVILASTTDYEFFQGISPNGGKVVYERAIDGITSHLYSVNLDDVTDTRILANSLTSFQPLVRGISPSGRVIYAKHIGGKFDLFSVNIDGTGTVNLTNSPQFDYFEQMSSSGRVIYTRDIGVTQFQYDLYSVNPDGTGTVTLANSTDSEIFQGISPIGRVIYWKNNDLYSVNADGTGMVDLTKTPANSDNFGGFSANGQVIYEKLAGSGGQYDLQSVNPDGTGTVVLANSADPEFYAGISPNGRVIYMARPFSGPIKFDLYSVNLNGTGTATLANSADDERFVAISPGGRVIYRRVVNGGQSDLYSVNADGTGLAALANSTDDEFFAGMSPSGQVIYRQVVSGGHADLYGINADGTGRVTLASSPEDEQFAGITPSGRIIYQSKVVGGTQQDLYSINPDGTGRVTLANTPSDEGFAGTF